MKDRNSSRRSVKRPRPNSDDVNPWAHGGRATLGRLASDAQRECARNAPRIAWATVWAKWVVRLAAEGCEGLRRFSTVVATGLAAAFLTGCDEHGKLERTFIASCEEVLKERLRAPSTYVRVEKPEVRVETRTIADQEFESMVDSEGYSPLLKGLAREQRAAGEAYVESTWYSTTIRYDAENAFGTPMRGIASCASGESYTGTPSGFDVGRSGVVVAGKTQIEWVLEQSEKALDAYRRSRR